MEEGWSSLRFNFLGREGPPQSASPAAQANVFAGIEQGRHWMVGTHVETWLQITPPPPHSYPIPSKLLISSYFWVKTFFFAEFS
jgi:hypothetical protein